MTTVAVCVGNRGEMLFGGRRVSRDALLLDDLVRDLRGRLICRPFSERYLVGAGLTPTVADDPFAIATAEDLVFFEEPPLAPHLPQVGRIIRYDFDTAYPIDVTLDVDPLAVGFHLAARHEFAGKAHQNIICEVFER